VCWFKLTPIIAQHILHSFTATKGDIKKNGTTMTSLVNRDFQIKEFGKPDFYCIVNLFSTKINIKGLNYPSFVQINFENL
jgi:hypothetical protein